MSAAIYRINLSEGGRRVPSPPCRGRRSDLAGGGGESEQPLWLDAVSPLPVIEASLALADLIDRVKLV